MCGALEPLPTQFPFLILSFIPILFMIKQELLLSTPYLEQKDKSGVFHKFVPLVQLMNGN